MEKYAGKTFLSQLHFFLDIIAVISRTETTKLVEWNAIHFEGIELTRNNRRFLSSNESHTWNIYYSSKIEKK